MNYKKILINGKQVSEHRYVMEKFLGRKLLIKEMVHHKDGNKLNNNINNLEVITNHKEHMQKHLKLKNFWEKRAKQLPFQYFLHKSKIISATRNIDWL